MMAALFTGNLIKIMTAVLSLDASWQLADLVCLPPELSPWLAEPGSLTARLKAHSTEFRLQLLQESKQVLPVFLQQCFTDKVESCIRREVIMWCNGQPAVYAQSWLPEQSIQQLEPLLALGEQPLGEILFQFPDVVRSPIEIAELNVQAKNQWVGAGTYWARRSIFSVAGHPLLVAEVFLPGVILL